MAANKSVSMSPVKQEIIKCISTLSFPGINIIAEDEMRVIGFLYSAKDEICKKTGAPDMHFYYHDPTLDKIKDVDFNNEVINLNKNAPGSLDLKLTESGSLPRISAVINSISKKKSQLEDKVKGNSFFEKSGILVFILNNYGTFLGENEAGHDERISIRLSFESMLSMNSAAPFVILTINSADNFNRNITRLCRTFDFPLPESSEIEEVVDKVTKDKNNTIDNSGLKSRIVRNCLGLELSDVKTLASRIALEDYSDEKNILKIISKGKQRIIRNSQSLELVENKEDKKSIGGLDNLKKWLEFRTRFFSDPQSADKFEENKGLEHPKGLLLVGLPGCGKSLSAKAAGAIYNIPLIRFDVASTFGKWVGQTEENMRMATRIAEAMAPCILWIDEIEKAFSGASGSGDGGTGTRSFGHFLTWMQECEKPVFIFATANNITDLEKSNPEFFRYGRFDEKFFVDLPNTEERKVIWKIHVTKRSSLELSPEEYNDLVLKSEEWTGAEIEACCKDAAITAFGKGKDKLSSEDIFAAAEKIKPQAKSSETLQELRELKGKLQFQDASL